MTHRVLCLGNTLLADDALGIVVAQQLRSRYPDLDVVESSASGFDLLDLTLGVRHLLVVDIFKSGTLRPGTVSIFREQDLQAVPGGSPHYIGLFDALRLGKELSLAVPEDVAIIAVEPADCITVGGPMDTAVEGAIPVVLDLVRRMTS